MNNTVIITGALGFVGSHTAKYFKTQGFRVIGIDLRETIPGANTWLDQWYQGDFVDAIIPAIEKYSSDLVIHCAGSSLVGPSIKYPGEYYDNNTSKTNKMLEALEKYLDWRGTMVFSSSAAVYGMPRQIPIPEMHEKNPISPYGSSKLFTESIIRDHCVASGIRGIALRYFNAAGCDLTGDLGHVESDSHIIPRIFSAYYTGNTFVINGDDFPTPDGTCIRDYVHVEDIARAHLAAANLTKSFDPGEFRSYNIGTGSGYSNLEIVQACEKYLSDKINVKIGPARLGDPAELVADSWMFQKQTNWKPVSSHIDTLVSSAGFWHKQKYQK